MQKGLLNLLGGTELELLNVYLHLIPVQVGLVTGSFPAGGNLADPLEKEVFELAFVPLTGFDTGLEDGAEDIVDVGTNLLKGGFFDKYKNKFSGGQN